MWELLNRANRVRLTVDHLRDLGHADLADELEDRERRRLLQEQNQVDD